MLCGKSEKSDWPHPMHACTPKPQNQLVHKWTTSSMWTQSHVRNNKIVPECLCGLVAYIYLPRILSILDGGLDVKDRAAKRR